MEISASSKMIERLKDSEGKEIGDQKYGDQIQPRTRKFTTIILKKILVSYLFVNRKALPYQ